MTIVCCYIPESLRFGANPAVRSRGRQLTISVSLQKHAIPRSSVPTLGIGAKSSELTQAGGSPYQEDFLSWEPPRFHMSLVVQNAQVNETLISIILWSFYIINIRRSNLYVI